MIDSIDYDDLVKFRSDLLSGGRHIKTLVSKRMAELESDAKVCVVCGKPIIYGDDSFTLIFGKDDFKKKASFCAIDCMNYFMTKIKKRSLNVSNTSQDNHDNSRDGTINNSSND